MLTTTTSFAPGQTQTLTLTTASQSLTLNANSSQARVLMVGGTAGALVFVRIGTGAQTAVVTDYPMLPGAEVFLMKGVGADHMAAIGNSAASGAVLYVTTGH